MSVETQLRDVLHREAARAPADAGDLGRVRRRGRRRRRLRAGAAGLAGAAVLALLVVVVGPVGQPGPTITPVSGGLKNAALVLCDVRSCPIPTDQQIEDLERQLAADPNVVSYTFETPEQTRDRFADALDNRPGLVDSLDVDTLPSTVGLRVRDVAELTPYVDWPGVDRVIVADGLPLPLTAERVTAELRQYDAAGPGLRLLHLDVVGDSLVAVAERPATARELELSDARRGLLYTWKPDPEAISTWQPVGGINVPIGPDGWTATTDLEDGTRVLAWGSVTDPTARIELPGGLLRAPTTYGITGPSGLAVIEGDGDPKIVTD